MQARHITDAFSPVAPGIPGLVGFDIQLLCRPPIFFILFVDDCGAAVDQGASACETRICVAVARTPREAGGNPLVPSIGRRVVVQVFCQDAGTNHELPNL